MVSVETVPDPDEKKGLTAILGNIPLLLSGVEDFALGSSLLGTAPLSLRSSSFPGGS